MSSTSASSTARPASSPTTPGFLSTASCNSTITYIDGDKGELLYRGYPIEQLATQCDFMETCYLLLKGELPTPDTEGRVHASGHAPHDGQRADAVLPARLPSRRAPDGDHDGPGRRGFRRSITTAPTSITPLHREISAIRLIAKMPTLVSMAYKYTIGQPYIYPKNDLSYAGNFMRMMFATPCEDYDAERGAGSRDGPDLHPPRRPRAERVDVDRAPVRLVGHEPVRGDRGRRGLPLWGPAHGGANEAALNMLEDDPEDRAASRRSATSSSR